MKIIEHKQKEAKGLQTPMNTWMQARNLRSYQAAFGHLCGAGLEVSFQTFMNWIHGKYVPTVRHALVLVKEGVLTWDWFSAGHSRR